jgi:hypothetical protein
LVGSNGPESLGPLKYAEDDARRLRSVLESERCGFEVVTILASEGAAPSAVVDSLSSMLARCEPSDTVIFYVSSHGELERGDLFLRWRNTEGGHLTHAIPVADVLLRFRHCRAEKKLLVLDCCHAGAVSGVKAASDRIDSMLTVGEYFVVLAASDRLEKAREFPEYKGSFLTVALVDFIRAARGHVTLSDAVHAVSARALEHNGKSGAPVPVPMLIGDSRGSFSLTAPPQTVLVRFGLVFEPDIATLQATMLPYADWNEIGSANIPVAVALAEPVERRASALTEMAESDVWPRPDLMSVAAKQQAAQVGAAGDRIKEEMVAVVRCVQVWTRNRILKSREADMLLEAYLSAKACSYARLLASFMLEGETDEPWMHEFFNVSKVYNVDIIHGLVYTSAALLAGCQCWRDADVTLYGDRRIRVYLPEILVRHSAPVDRDGIIRFVLPQVLDAIRYDATMLLAEPDSFRPVFRDEMLVDVATADWVDRRKFSRAFAIRERLTLQDETRSLEWREQFYYLDWDVVRRTLEESWASEDALPYLNRIVLAIGTVSEASVRLLGDVVAAAMGGGAPVRVPADFVRNQSPLHGTLRELRDRGAVSPESGGTWQAGSVVRLTPLALRAARLPVQSFPS